MDVVALRPENETALCEFLEDFDAAGEDLIPAYFADRAWSTEEVVARLAAWSRGEHLPQGWVPCTTSFLVDDGRLLGVVNLRHVLTDALRACGGHVGFSVCPSARRQGHARRLLEAAKRQAQELGIDQLLVTCDEENPASRRVIERCGGVYADTVRGELTGPTQRFWIRL